MQNFHSLGFVVSKRGEPYLWQSKPHLVPGSLQQRNKESMKGFAQFSLQYSYLKTFSIEFRSEQTDDDCVAEFSDKDDSGLFHATISSMNIFLLVVVISPLQVNSVFLLLVT